MKSSLRTNNSYPTDHIFLLSYAISEISEFIKFVEIKKSDNNLHLVLLDKNDFKLFTTTLVDETWNTTFDYVLEDNIDRLTMLEDKFRNLLGQLKEVEVTNQLDLEHCFVQIFENGCLSFIDGQVKKANLEVTVSRYILEIAILLRIMSLGEEKKITLLDILYKVDLGKEDSQIVSFAAGKMSRFFNDIKGEISGTKNKAILWNLIKFYHKIELVRKEWFV
jgi:hypothetical protein